MNVFLALLVPLIFLLTFLYALVKKVKVYDSFTDGIKGAIPLILSLFPYVAAVTMLSLVMEVSGLGEMLTQWLSPFFSRVGVPTEIAPLIFMKPLSGSGSIAVLTQIIERYGVDSYAARCACVVYGSSETVFYIGAVYFAGIQRKKLNVAIFIALIAYLASIVLCCALCKIL